VASSDPRDEHGNVIYDEGVTLAQTWQALEHLVDDGNSVVQTGVPGFIPRPA
jgi:hypothetical protein